MGDSRAFPVDASALETMKDLPDKRAGTWERNGRDTG